MPENSLFLKALKGEKIERFPVWLMRQAGRYMPQYRELRSRVNDFLELCRNAELATEITLLPERLLGVDALILFSDILVPLTALGIDVKFVEGKGPTLKFLHPEKWKGFDPSEVDYVLETVRRVKEKSQLPLIGFAGGPFTLGAYILEGKTSREFVEIRKTFYGNRELFDLLMEKLSDMLVDYLSAQIEAGADAVQVFDSWVWVMSPEMFESYAPYLEKLLKTLKSRHPEVPIIYFFRGSGHLYKKAFELPADAFSIDWSLDMEIALREVGKKALQGNLDPTVLYAPKKVIKRETENLLKKVSSLRETLYVFNLGHGLSSDMELEKVKFLVEVVKGFRLP